jgi:hypothetical protein
MTAGASAQDGSVDRGTWHGDTGLLCFTPQVHENL